MIPNKDGVVYLSDLKQDAEFGRERFKLNNQVVFINGAGIWGELNGLTCVIKEISNDPIYTFRIEIDREDLIGNTNCWNANDDDKLIIWCSAGNLCFENEIQECQKNYINRGQSKDKPVTDLDSLFPDDQVIYSELSEEEISTLFHPSDISGKGLWEPDPNKKNVIEIVC